MNLIFQTWAHIKKDLLIYEIPLAQIKESKMNKLLKLHPFILFIFITGCYNSPTPPSEITGAQISGLQYQQFDCETLNDEINFLENRERELILAQENRIKESELQQWWTEGSGTGDGIEASELNRVKGEIKAARRVFENKECNVTK